MPMRVSVVTGTRADYGLVQPVLTAMHGDPAFEPVVLATAMHLAPEFGSTVGEIEADGFAIDARVEILDPDDSGLGVARAVGRATAGLADAFVAGRPDLVMVTGDRFEQLAAAQAALFLRLPVAHLFGGDLTEGAFDDSMRHAITKLAHLHFVSNEDSARRVRQLGEDPANVHLVGSPGIDSLINAPRLPRPELERELGVALTAPVLLLTFHPATLDIQPATEQLAEVLNAVDVIRPTPTVIATKSNADPGGRAVNAALDAWAAGRSNVRVFASLGIRRYASLLSLADVMVGNSSSGLYEAPSFCLPTVNVGDRQAGRLRATSVIDIEPRAGPIAGAIERALAGDWSDAVNPYGDGHATERIMAVLRELRHPEALVRKRFHELPA